MIKNLSSHVSDTIKFASLTLHRYKKEYKSLTHDSSLLYSFNYHEDEIQLDKYLKLDSHLSKQLQSKIRNFVLRNTLVSSEKEGLVIAMRGYGMVFGTEDNYTNLKKVMVCKSNKTKRNQ